MQPFNSMRNSSFTRVSYIKDRQVSSWSANLFACFRRLRDTLVGILGSSWTASLRGSSSFKSSSSDKFPMSLSPAMTLSLFFRCCSSLWDWRFLRLMNLTRSVLTTKSSIDLEGDPSVEVSGLTLDWNSSKSFSMSWWTFFPFGPFSCRRSCLLCLRETWRSIFLWEMRFFRCSVCKS